MLVTNDHLVARRPPPASDLRAVLDAHLPTWLRPLRDPLVQLLSRPIISAYLASIESFTGYSGGWVAAISLSSVVENGQVQQHEVEIVVPHIGFANGIDVSPTGDTVAVASTTTPAVVLYDLTFPQGKPHLQFSTSISTPMLPDNLHFTPPAQAAERSDVLAAVPEQARSAPQAAEFERGRLTNAALRQQGTWGGAALVVAGHPGALKLGRFAHDPKATPAGSWVVAISGSIRPAEVGQQSVRKVKALEDGAPLPAAQRARHPPNKEWTIKTLYQSAAGSEQQTQAKISTSSAALWDPRHKVGTGQGHLLVTGLYARGVLWCNHVGLD